MDERPKLPHYDPDYCLKAAKWAASTCVGILLIELLVLLFVAPRPDKCPGWTMYAENGTATPLWILAGIISGGSTILIWYFVLRWEQRFSQEVYDRIAYRDDRPRFPYLGFGKGPKFNSEAVEPDQRELNFEQILFVDANSECTIACAIWSLLCVSPLLLMITMCTNVPRYLGYWG
jgi:hypothetical protein